jgi:uncharacterized protein
MKWQELEESRNVEDVRGQGGGGGGGRMIGGGMGVLVLAAIVYFLGGDPMVLLSQMGSVQSGSSSQESYVPTEESEAAKLFATKILGGTEKVWQEEFTNLGKTYVEPQMQLFSSRTNSGCGPAGAEMGPFYCPADQKIYIDLSFFDQMRRDLGAPGDFAAAYVIAHEVGHHVQKLFGISDQVHKARQSMNEVEYNKLSVKLELQADFFAGLWAKKISKFGKSFDFIEDGDLEEAITAANAIGDDTLQRKSQGRVTPHAFTHGSSEQRVKWFMKGYKTGDIRQGDTFNSPDL